MRTPLGQISVSLKYLQNQSRKHKKRIILTKTQKPKTKKTIAKRGSSHIFKLSLNKTTAMS